MNSKIILIVPYFGNTPNWLPYFLHSCKANNEIHWLIYSNLDIDPDWGKNKNLQIEKKSLADFNKLASQKLNIKVSISNPYKICDFKPAFGLIFSDYTQDYKYWGYCDIDIIFGKISDFLPSNTEYDIITTGKKFLSGHLTLYKNNQNLNNLFRKIWRINSMLLDYNRIYYLDEASNYIGRKLSNQTQKRYDRKTNIIERIINSLKFRILKKISFSYDIWKVVEKEKKVSDITIYRLKNMASDENFLKNGIKTWNLQWEKGTLKNLESGEELLYFHFIKSKENLQIQKTKISSSFYLTEQYINL